MSKILKIIGIAILALCQVLDVYLTKYLIQTGYYYEGNPIAAFILDLGGYDLLLLLKLTAVALFAIVAFRGEEGIRIAALYFTVVLYMGLNYLQIMEVLSL